MRLWDYGLFLQRLTLRKKKKKKMNHDVPLDEWKKAVCLEARRGNKDLVCTMLTERGVHIKDVEVEGRSILHFAVASGNADLVNILLSFRCNPNQQSPFGACSFNCCFLKTNHLFFCVSLP